MTQQLKMQRRLKSILVKEQNVDAKSIMGIIIALKLKSFKYCEKTVCRGHTIKRKTSSYRYLSEE